MFKKMFLLNFVLAIFMLACNPSPEPKPDEIDDKDPPLSEAAVAMRTAVLAAFDVPSNDGLSLAAIPNRFWSEGSITRLATGSLKLDSGVARINHLQLGQFDFNDGGQTASGAVEGDYLEVQFMAEFYFDDANNTVRVSITQDIIGAMLGGTLMEDVIGVIGSAQLTFTLNSDGRTFTGDNVPPTEPNNLFTFTDIRNNWRMRETLRLITMLI
ncbi:MAG: hypothetical protein FWE37_08510 [Spirochaetaceae bacterium]|nr:hypothetical protein [Spirochaetaceae bacterium]